MKEVSRKKLLTSRMYNNQVKSSIRRGHNQPSYSMLELREWVFSRSNFLTLYNTWEESGYKKEYAPSADRLDDKKGYNFNNIRLVAWKDNIKKQNALVRQGLSNVTMKHIPVNQLSSNGDFIATFVSSSDAARKTHSCQSLISKCCSGKQNIHNGFKWEYAEESIRKYKVNIKSKLLKSVFQYTKAGVLVSEFESVVEASRETGILRSAISMALTGRANTSGGFIWKYKDKK